MSSLDRRITRLERTTLGADRRAFLDRLIADVESDLGEDLGMDADALQASATLLAYAVGPPHTLERYVDHIASEDQLTPDEREELAGNIRALAAGYGLEIA